MRNFPSAKFVIATVILLCLVLVSAADPKPVAVQPLLPPGVNNLGPLLRNLDRDPEIKYFYKKIQHYIVDRIQRAAVQEPRVGNEEEIFDDLLINHGVDRTPHYDPEEREIVKGKLVALVKLMNLTRVNSGDL